MYLFLDCETGGLDPDTSLLTLGMIVTDKQFTILDSKEWLLKPDDGIYKVTGQALQVNKIDLANHDKDAVFYKQAKTEVYNFLKKWFDNCGWYCNEGPLIPVGKNIYFDLLRIWDNLVSRPTWETFVSYQPLELNGVVRYLQLTGKIPSLAKTSLGDLCNHFNISVPPTWLHNAVGDCRLYIELMQRLVQL